jgi:hypothetical protein
MVSVGLHAVVLLGAALIYIDSVLAEVTVWACPTYLRTDPPPQYVPVPEKREELEHRGKLPTLDKADQEALEKPILNPLAELGKRNESKDDLPYESVRGDSKDFPSWLPGDGPGLDGTLRGATAAGTSSTMGVGATNGYRGRFGDPDGGGRKNLRTFGGDPGTESGVVAALRWLARHQTKDGSWRADRFTAECQGNPCSGPGDSDYDPGVTSLAVLAFLGAGFTPMSKDELVDPAFPDRPLRVGPVVKKGLQWLVAAQDPEGCVGPRGPKYLYNHAIAALALSEAYGMTSAPVLQDHAQKAIDFLVAAQNPGRGWRYGAQCGDNDSSVTGWAVMALKSAELSDLHFPKRVFDGALSWFQEATEKNGYYRVGYTQAGTGKVFEAGRNEAFADHPAMTAVAVMSRIFIQKNAADPALGGVHLLLSDLPAWKSGTVDFYYWYYGSLALFQKDGPSGPMWKKWNEPMKQALVPHQHLSKDGCQNGSWNPDEDRWGHAGGRVYAVALNALTLEVYYRYANVFGGSGKK